MLRQKRNHINTHFRRLINEQGDRIYNLALMKSGNTVLAEDICQETFMRVYKGMKNFRHESQLRTWVYRIALNVCHTVLKRESFKSQVQSQNSEIVMQIEDDTNIEGDFIQKSMKQLIHNAIARLPSKQSDVITLYYLKEFQYTEVAEIMQIPINTVKSHLRRAKQNLRELMKEVEL